jgi:excisionase family DNA binding protein
MLSYATSMLTVPEAARRMRRDPETIRRWIRSGRLRSRRVGTQHVIDESDLLVLMPVPGRSLPAAWRKTATGEPMPDVVRAVRRSREGR